jgi:hypothetical protein
MEIRHPRAFCRHRETRLSNRPQPSVHVLSLQNQLLREGGFKMAEGPLVPPAAVREELSRVLASHEFRASKRCQDFLRYVVETSLDGRADQLKERVIGIDVFGRSTDYDPSDDATVRVKAGEVRKRLGLYYAGEGHKDEVRIELPGGAYLPEFRVVSELPAPRLPAPAEPTPSPQIVHRKSYGWMALASLAAALAVVALCIYIFRARLEPRTVVDQFWQPVLQQAATPVILSAAYVPVYTPTRPPQEGPPQTAADFTLLTDQFVGGGDMLAIASLSSMLNRMHRPYQVKIGTEVSFSDLRSSPTVLVGYSYTRWKDISKEMRYFIDAERRPLMILDNGKPTQWRLFNLTPDKHTDEDYAIVSRVFHPDTRTLLVEIAGITQYGTTAAAELVTNPDLLRDALKDAPDGWQKKNLQFVLHTKVISGMAASQSVVGAYYW